MARSIDELHTGLKLMQDDRFFKLGEDSVLLSDFAKVKTNDKICDLGCGNGAISVLLYGKNPKIQLDAVEIQKEVYELALENAKLNNINMNIHLKDATKVKEYLKNEYYDIVITNPPYFKENTGLTSTNINKKIARTEENLTIEKVCESAKYLLKYGGKLYIVQKPERTSDIFRNMFINNIEPKRIQYIYSNKNKNPSTVLIEGKKGAKSGLIVLPPLITRNEDLTYTKELLEIYKR